jgi:transposase
MKPTQEATMNIIGIDLGKTVFHLVVMNPSGAVIAKKRLSRAQLITLLGNTPPSLVAMEASCGAHYLGRQFVGYGHDVKLIPAQFVRPFVKSQKNDYVDAEAIAEAAQRPTMRFVPIKTEDQLDLQALHRVRERLVERRTAAINQFRAFLLERGIVVRTGREQLLKLLPDILVKAEQHLAPRMARLLAVLAAEWRMLEEEIAGIDQEISRIAATDQACIRLQTVPGIGPLIATAMVAAVGNGAAFARGREFAAWLGLIPRQSSTGGKTKLLGICKRGNTYLRWLFIHGGRSVQHRVSREPHAFGHWLTQLESRAHSNVVGVAMANKLARIAWVVLNRQEVYRPTGRIPARGAPGFGLKRSDAPVSAGAQGSSINSLCSALTSA